jgi:hypothetical protein
MKAILNLALVLLFLLVALSPSIAHETDEDFPAELCARFNLTHEDVDARIAEMNAGRPNPIWTEDGYLTLNTNLHYCTTLQLAEEQEKLEEEQQVRRNLRGVYIAIVLFTAIAIGIWRKRKAEQA